MERKRLLFKGILLVVGVEIVFFAAKDRLLERTYKNAVQPLPTGYRIEKIMKSPVQPIIASSIDCQALFNGSKSEIEKARNLTQTLNAEKLPEGTQEKDLLFRTSDCQRYILNRGFISDELSEKEANFSIAYSIVIYKDVLQFEQLLRAIYRPQNIYCVHVDIRSSKSVFQAIGSVAKCFSKVFLPQSRIKVIWGKMSVLEVELICMKELLTRNKKWKYFINLTGQEFPLKTNAELVEILTALNDSNAIAGDHASLLKKRRFKNQGPVPHGLNTAIGSLHIVVSRAFVEFAVHDQRAKDLLNWTSQTRIPDETFFNTLNLNPSLKIPGSYKYEDFKKPSDQMIMRFKKWRMDTKCKGRIMRDVCVLGIDYLPQMSTSVEVFANKFFWDYDRISLQCMDELLHNRTRDAYLDGLKFNASWYSTLDFVVNKIQ